MPISFSYVILAEKGTKKMNDKRIKFLNSTLQHQINDRNSKPETNQVDLVQKREREYLQQLQQEQKRQQEAAARKKTGRAAALERLARINRHGRPNMAKTPSLSRETGRIPAGQNVQKYNQEMSQKQVRVDMSRSPQNNKNLNLMRRIMDRRLQQKHYRNA